MAGKAVVVQLGARVSYEGPGRSAGSVAGLEGVRLPVTPTLPVQLFAVLDSGEKINSEPGFSVGFPKLPAAGGAPRTEAERRGLLDGLVAAIRRSCLELAEQSDRLLLRDILDPRGIEVDLLEFEDLPFALELDPGLQDELEQLVAGPQG